MRGIHRDTDVDVLLANHLLALHVQGHVELGQFRQRRRAGLEQERKRGHLHALLLARCLLGLAEALHLGDVGFVELGHVGHVQPAALHVGSRGRHHARHGLTFHLAELAEVRQLHTRNAGAGGYTAALLGLLQLPLNIGLDVVLHDSAFRTAALHAGQVRT